MKNFHKYILSLIVLFISFTRPGFAENGRDPYVYFFNETWGDYSEELDKAKEEGKKGVLIFFELDGCPYCRKMKETVLNQPEVQAYYRKYFLLFSINIESNIEITDFKGNTITQKKFSRKVNKVYATPVFGFYDLSGRQVVRYTGATADIKEFMWLGEYFVSEKYKEIKFSDYKRLKSKKNNKPS